MRSTHGCYTRCICLLIMGLVLGLTSISQAQNTPEARDRFVLIVAHNNSLRSNVPALRYADDDGARFYELLAPGAREAFLLTTFDQESQELYPQLVDVAREPSRRNLTQVLDTLKTSIQASHKAGRKTVLHVFFTGHGELQEGGMEAPKAYFSLTDGAWTREDMVEQIVAPQWADFTHVTIDACNAYFLVQGRGDWKEDQETDPEYLQAIQDYLATPRLSERYPRTGWLLSTSGAQEVHEWGRYQAGVFSHQLRSALVGAADVDGDGVLRYDEIEAYIGAANAAVSNPSARISMTAQPPSQKNNAAFLIPPRELKPRAVLQIPQGQAGHFVIEDNRGLRYADVSTIGDRSLQIALLDGGRNDASFYVRKGSEEAHVTSKTGDPLLLSALNWRPTSSQPRSSIDEAFRAELFAVPFSADFHRGYIARSKLSPEAGPNITINTTEGDEDDGIPLSMELGLGLGNAVIRQAESELRVGLGLRMGQRTGLYGRVALDFGLSYQEEMLDEVGEVAQDAADLYRLSYEVGAGYQLGLWNDTITLGPELSLGHMWLWADPDDNSNNLQGDRTGIRGALGAILNIHFSDSLYASANANISGNITSVLNRVEEQVLLNEELTWQPGLQLRLGYTF
ncbi:MAG: hypothetical protein AAFS10_13275 [Myxococcota bacterium]